MKNNPEVSALIYLQFILILLKVTNVQPFASYTWLSLTAIFWVPMAIGTALLLFKRKKS
jgi:hypothetical protein